MLSHISNLIGIVFDEDATATELLKLVMALAIFWMIAFYLISVLLRPLVYGRLKPLLTKAAEGEYVRSGKKMMEDLGLKLTKEEFVDSFLENWARTISLAMQHTSSGIICLPAIMKWGDPSVASSLACLGALSEVGFEIQDYASLIYKRIFLPDGNKKVPTALLVFLGMHHCLAITMGLPMVLNYRNLNVLHWIVFDQLCASGLVLFSVEYNKLLDVTKLEDLRQIQIISFFILVVMVWTRLFHWLYLSFQLILMWYKEKAWAFLVVGSFICIIFSTFNWITTKPCYKHFVKFNKMLSEYKALPADADFRTRRSSAMELQESAVNLVARNDIQEEVLGFFIVRNVERRRTMNDVFFNPKKICDNSVNKERTRISMVALRSMASAKLD